MPRTLNKLSARQVDTVKKPGRYSDGGHLYLVVTPAGSRNWAFIYTRQGKRREMGLGPAGKGGVGLARARELAQQYRDHLNEGRDPLGHRRTEREAVGAIPAFGEYADKFIEAKGTEWRNAMHRAQWKMTLTDYCKSIRRKSVDAVDTEDVLAILRPIWTTKAETASRLRGRIENVLDAAKAEGFREGENPARWRGQPPPARHDRPAPGAAPAA